MNYEKILKMIGVLDQYARDTDPYEYGLPVYDGHYDQMAQIIIRELALDVEQDPRIATVMEYTGCSRKVAIDLIESGKL